MQPQQPYAPAPQQQPDYNFIMNPSAPGKPGLLNGNSMRQRLIVAGGGLVVLIIIVAIVANLLSSGSGSYFPSMLAVAQEQQEMIHLVTTASQSISTKLDTANANLEATLQLSMTSSKNDLLTYLQKNGYKVSTAQLNLKVSTATDTQLSNAAAAGNYDATFDSIVQSQLQTYEQYLKEAYFKDKGAKGRALLNSDYNQASLLLASMNSSH